MLPQILKTWEVAVTKLIARIEELPDTLNREPSSVPLPIETFRSVLAAHINNIHNILKYELNRYQMALSDTKLDAERDQHTDFFAQAMQPYYDAGRADRGRRFVQHCKNRLHDHITKEDPLGKANDLLPQAMEDKASYHAAMLQRRVNSIVKEIIRSFEGILCQQAESLSLIHI